MYKWRVDRLQDKTVRNKYQIKLGIYAENFFQTLEDLGQEGVVGEALVCRMASKWEKVVNRAASITLGCKHIICGRSVNRAVTPGPASPAMGQPYFLKKR